MPETGTKIAASISLGGVTIVLGWIFRDIILQPFQFYYGGPIEALVIFGALGIPAWVFFSSVWYLILQFASENVTFQTREDLGEISWEK